MTHFVLIIIFKIVYKYIILIITSRDTAEAISAGNITVWEIPISLEKN